MIARLNPKIAPMEGRHLPLYYVGPLQLLKVAIVGRIECVSEADGRKVQRILYTLHASEKNTDDWHQSLRLEL